MISISGLEKNSLSINRHYELFVTTFSYLEDYYNSLQVIEDLSILFPCSCAICTGSMYVLN